MKKKITVAMMVAAMSMSVMACGSSSDAPKETQAPAATEAATEAPATTEEATTEAPETEAADDGTINFETDKYVITYSKHEIGKDMDGNPCLLYYYTFTNNGDENTSAMASAQVQCFQNGVENELAYIDYEIPEYENYMKDIQPGGTIDVCEPFELQDTSDVDIEVSDWISFDGAKDTQLITIEE